MHSLKETELAFRLHVSNRGTIGSAMPWRVPKPGTPWQAQICAIWTEMKSIYSPSDACMIG